MRSRPSRHNKIADYYSARPCHFAHCQNVLLRPPLNFAWSPPLDPRPCVAFAPPVASAAAPPPPPPPADPEFLLGRIYWMFDVHPAVPWWYLVVDFPDCWEDDVKWIWQWQGNPDFLYVNYGETAYWFQASTLRWVHNDLWSHHWQLERSAHRPKWWKQHWQVL